jgi:hypothetical protein
LPRKAARAARRFTHVAAALRRPGTVAGGRGARSALGFVRRSRVAPVDQLAGFAAVPNLGVVGVVQAPAAELSSLRASATHARLGRVEIAYQGFGAGYGFISIFFFIFVISLGQRKRSQIFHSEGHVPVKRADGHVVLVSHQVNLTDDALRELVPLFSRLRPPLHLGRQVYLKTVRAETIAVTNGVLCSSYGIETLCLVDLQGTFAPELEREPGVLFHAIAVIVAVPQMQVRSNVTLRNGRLVPFGSFLLVRRVVPSAILVTLRGVKLSIVVSTFFCRSQKPGRRLPLVTIQPHRP